MQYFIGVFKMFCQERVEVGVLEKTIVLLASMQQLVCKEFD